MPVCNSPSHVSHLLRRETDKYIASQVLCLTSQRNRPPNFMAEFPSLKNCNFTNFTILHCESVTNTAAGEINLRSVRLCVSSRKKVLKLFDKLFTYLIVKCEHNQCICEFHRKTKFAKKNFRLLLIFDLQITLKGQFTPV